MKYTGKIQLLVLFLAMALAFGGGVKYHQLRAPASLEEGNGLLLSAASAQAEPEEIYVDVKGAVASPGLYQFPPGSRIAHALEKAEPLENAYLFSLNQAALLRDGQELIVYYAPAEGAEAGEGEGAAAEGAPPKELIAQPQALAADSESAAAGTGGGKVNINTANMQELETLPGIGPSKAGAIVNYRRDNGAFASIEEIKRVSGIGDATYANIKGLIVVD